MFPFLQVIFRPGALQSERDVNQLFGDIPDLVLPSFLDNWSVARAGVRNVTVSALPQVYHFPAMGSAPLYDSGRNTLAIPVGASAFPMFSPALVRAVNFGGLGRTVAAALAEPLYWRRLGWLEGAAQDIYNRRLSCLLSMFRSYQNRRSGDLIRSVADVEAYASFWGLPTLLQAYQSDLARAPRRLHRARTFTADQLFFISFCYTQCSREDTLTSKLICNIPLRNVPEFADVFNCGLGSYMSPYERCKDW